MNIDTKAALEASIARWKVLSETEEFPSLAASNCPLCLKFNYMCNNHIPRNKSCRGCPVFERTGKTGCADTPYDKAYAAADDWDENYTPESCEAFRQAAREELEFLISLREEGK